MKYPTQSDVAKLAGVSRATVSYVVNNQTGGRVPISAETRQRVLEAIDELGYVPDTRAQALRSGDTKTIGLVIPDIHNPHFWEIADGVEQEAYAAGYHILLSNIPPESAQADEVFRDLAHRRMDGLVMVPSFLYESEPAQKTLSYVLKRRVPVVAMMAGRSSFTFKLDRVISDYRDATIEAMNLLLAWQHRRIGILYGIAVPELGEDRMAAYRECLQNAGIALDPDLIVECGPTIRDGYQATLRLLKSSARPTALLAINDLLAIGALRAIRDLNLNVPEDISVFGYDDVPIGEYLIPRLSTASKGGEEIGRSAVRLILARLQEPDRPIQEIRLPTRVILRESMGPAPS